MIVIVDTFHGKLNNVIESIKKEDYIKTLESWASLKNLPDFENVYLATISIEEMKEVLNDLKKGR